MHDYIIGNRQSGNYMETSLAEMNRMVFGRAIKEIVEIDKDCIEIKLFSGHGNSWPRTICLKKKDGKWIINLRHER